MVIPINFQEIEQNANWNEILPFLGFNPIETARILTMVSQARLQIYLSVSDDELDYADAQRRENAFFAGQVVDDPSPAGFFKPIGLFNQDEQQKAYHKMFEHIPGEDGLCVWPNCNQPVLASDFTRAMEAADRYGDMFGSNLIELDALRLRLQDEESVKIVAKQVASRTLRQSIAPITPPDPQTVTTLPPKKNRRGHKKSNHLATSTSVNPSCNSNTADLRFPRPVKTFLSTDLIKCVVVAPKLAELDSTSLFSPVTTLPLQDLGPSSLREPRCSSTMVFDPCSDSVTLSSTCAPEFHPHHPHPNPHHPFHHTIPIPTPSLHPTPHPHPHPSPHHPHPSPHLPPRSQPHPLTVRLSYA